jgi:hypothetical protein
MMAAKQRGRLWEWIGIAGMVILLAVGHGYFKGCGRKTPTRETEENSSHLRTSSSHSQAWETGYRQGQRYADLDRNLASYKYFDPSDADKMRLAIGYSVGTHEYGDFWDGYKQGYLDKR